MHRFPNEARSVVSSTQSHLLPPPPPLPSTSSVRRLPSSRFSVAESEQEAAIAETDALTVALGKEIDALAAARRLAGLPTALAALCRQKRLDYMDTTFLPITTSLGPGGCRGRDAARDNAPYVVRWCAREAYEPRGRRLELLSSVGLHPSALRVGLLGNAGVVAGLAALAEAAGAVTSTLATTTMEDEANGVYSVWVCTGGVWSLVQVDAYLPCVEYLAHSDAAAGGPDRPLYGCANIAANDMWGSVCEKALAKVCGSYRATCQLDAATAVGCFTGGPVEVWDWWRRRSEVALEEMEAAINTSARGSGVVLLTTRSALSLLAPVDRERRRRGQATLQDLYPSDPAARLHSRGLLPGTAYRVLAVTENEAGEAMLLVRNWHHDHDHDQQQSVASDVHEEDGRRYSPERDDYALGSEDDPRLREACKPGQDTSSCVWLNYEQEVEPLFDHCHVCFDCRRYHDVRVPVQFSGHNPAVPSHVLRVRVPPCSEEAPARMWIGLHQPHRTQGLPSPPLPPFHWGLKLTLIGVDEERTMQQRRVLGTALLPPAYYILSESYSGEFQYQPAIWMFLELACEVETEFYILPCLEHSPWHEPCEDELLQRWSEHACRVAHSSTVSAFSYTTAMGSVDAVDVARGTRNLLSTVMNYKQSTATVAVLAEDRDAIDVELLRSPTEMTAALCHNVLERLDFATFEVEPSADGEGSGGPHTRTAGSARRSTAGSVRGEARRLSFTDDGEHQEEGPPLKTQVNGAWVGGFLWRSEPRHR